MVDTVGLSANEVAGLKLLVVDHQLAIQQMQLFEAGVAVRRIVGTWCEAYEHGYAIRFLVDGEQFARDAFCYLFPLWFCMERCRRPDRFSGGFVRDSSRKTLPERCRRTQHVYRPRYK